MVNNSGLSLNALAQLSGISKGYLSQIENSDSTRPSAETVTLLAQALGVPLTDLIADTMTEPVLPVSHIVRCPECGAALRLSAVRSADEA